MGEKSLFKTRLGEHIISAFCNVLYMVIQKSQPFHGLFLPNSTVKWMSFSFVRLLQLNSAQKASRQMISCLESHQALSLLWIYHEQRHSLCQVQIALWLLTFLKTWIEICSNPRVKSTFRIYTVWDYKRIQNINENTKDITNALQKGVKL